MTHEFCLRCGRRLTNIKSKELGYGSTCYRITQLNKQELPKTDLNMEINFIKTEINFIKTQLRTIKINGVSDDSIERINLPNKPIIPSKEIMNMTEVINEFKSVINDIKNYLKPIGTFDKEINFKDNTEQLYR